MRLSIITINFNNSNGLEKTIRSVVNQSVLSQVDVSSEKIEYIIIDGGSTDGSVDVIKSFLANSVYRNTITYWCSEKDTGIYNAMNKGVSHANGEYCLFLNSGDVFVSDTVIENILPELKNEDIISCNESFSDGTVAKPIKDLNLFSYMDGFLPHESTFIRTERLKKTPYEENYRIVSDYIFFLKDLFFNKATYRTVNQIITLFNLDGISSNNRKLAVDELNLFYSKTFPPYIMELYESLSYQRRLCKNPIVRFAIYIVESKFYHILRFIYRKIKGKS